MPINPRIDARETDPTDPASALQGQATLRLGLHRQAGAVQAGTQVNAQPGVTQIDDPTGSGTGVPAKYLLFNVPNWNRAEDEDEQMGSYLRLGSVPDPANAANPNAPPSTGEDLAAYATWFMDDTRVREGCPDYVPPSVRQAETAVLHTKGGWRDHSDGNRVSTTRGDKVEVIRGSYKMVVLGRQDDPGSATGWDASGGNIEGVGGRSCISWTQTWDGTWKTVEESEKGDTYVTQHGNSRFHGYGDIQESVTGSEDQTRPSWDQNGNPITVPSRNPHITEHTWARAMESYTGSSGCRVPSIVNETWADTLTSKTNAHSMTDHTQVSGTMSNTTIAGIMSNVNIAGQMANINLIGNTTNLNIGGMENITVGALLDVTIALMAQISLSATLAITAGPRLDYNLSSKEGLHALRTDLAGVNSRIVAGVDSTVAAVQNVAAGMINFF
jgi:hypothetical protein